jgi:hypothetical protein
VRDRVRGGNRDHLETVNRREAALAWLAMRTGEQPAAEALAGHTDLATTQRYAHMVTNDLQAAIARLERGKGVAMSPGRG